VAGVQLDGGEDSLTGRSSGSKGSGISKGSSAGISKRGGTSISKWGTKTSISKWGTKTSISKWGSNSRGSVSNVGNNGTGSSGVNTTEKTSTDTIGTSIWVWKDSGEGSRGSNLISSTPLSLLSNSLFSSRLLRGSGGCSSSGSVSSSKFSLGSSNLRSVNNGNWEGEVENGSDKGLNDRGNGKVGSGNSESIDGISNVVDSLEKTIGVNILVGAGGHSIGIAGLSTG